MRAITYGNLDVTLGREIRLDLPGLVARLVDARRGGYCYELNTNPLGPVPLGGEATSGGWTWRTGRTTTPEDEDAWQMCLADVVLYPFTDDPRHPTDYIAPNHHSSTHPRSVFTGLPIVQRSDDLVQTILVGLTLTERYPDGTEQTGAVAPGDDGPLLRDRFGLGLGDDEIARLLAAATAPPA